MASDVVQAHYDELGDIAKRFKEQSEASDQMQRRVRKAFDALQRGGWEGQGSEAFCQEMADRILPALDRLSQALAEGNRATLAIARLLKEAEEEAAQLFPLGQGGGAAGGGAVNTALGAAASAAASGSPANAASGTSPAANAAGGPQAAQGAANYDFTLSREIGSGKWESRRPHWPENDASGLSGVTIGPGYDMGSRSKADIIRDLTQAGVDEKTAGELAEGAGKRGTDAKQWVADWKNAHGKSALAISREEEKALFENVLVPKYVDRAKIAVAKYNGDWEQLSGEQRAMLFDVEYNGGLAKYPKFTQAVLAQDWQEVSQQHQRHIRVNGVLKDAPRNAKFEERFGYLWQEKP